MDLKALILIKNELLSSLEDDLTVEEVQKLERLVEKFYLAKLEEILSDEDAA